MKSFSPLMLVVCAGRSPCGERGLKCTNRPYKEPKLSRSPCGERGLKYKRPKKAYHRLTVAPRAGSVD